MVLVFRLLVLDQLAVVHRDPGVLKTQELDKLVLIHMGLRQPDASNQCPENLILGFSTNQQNRWKISLALYGVVNTDNLEGIKVGHTFLLVDNHIRQPDLNPYPHFRQPFSIYQRYL